MKKMNCRIRFGATEVDAFLEVAVLSFLSVARNLL